MKSITDATQAVISKARKIRDLADAERDVGNELAADNFTTQMHALLLRHRLEMSDIEGEEVEFVAFRRFIDWEDWGFTERSRRNGFRERLATVIGNAHGCRILVIPGADSIGFIGREESTAVCEYVLVTLRRFFEASGKRAGASHRAAVKDERTVVGSRCLGFSALEVIDEMKSFRSSFEYAFVVRLQSRYVALSEVANDEQGAGLMVLKDDLSDVNKHLDESDAPGLGSIEAVVKYNAHGYASGTAAANDAQLEANGVDAKPQAVAGIGE